MSRQLHDSSATFVTTGHSSRSSLALDVLPRLLDAATSHDVAAAVCEGAVAHFARAAAIDHLDPVLGARRVAAASAGGRPAPNAWRHAPSRPTRAWRVEDVARLPPEAADALFPSVGAAHAVLAVPLHVDGACRGYLWLLVPEDVYDTADLEVAHAIGLWADVALTRAARTEALSRTFERERELLAVVEHELRGPLGNVLGWVRLLSSEPASETERMRRGLSAIDRGGRTMMRVIEDWHEVSALLLGSVTLERRTTSVLALAREVVDARSDALAASGTRVALHFEDADDVSASIDATRVREMIARMLDRIERCTPVGGQLDVRVASRRQAVLIVVESRGSDRVEAEDDEARDAAGARGATPARLSERTLTLALVRGIAELHGGSAGAERPGSGVGSRIWALLPRGLSPSITQEIAHGSEEMDLRGVHVLLVDDARDSLELAATMVRLRGAHAVLASSTSEALEMLATLPIDVLVSDIAMPAEDGCSLIRRAHELRPDLRAAALSAHVLVEDRERALAAGFETYLTKPVDAEVLARVVRSLAHRPPSASAGS